MARPWTALRGWALWALQALAVVLCTGAAWAGQAQPLREELIEAYTGGGMVLSVDLSPDGRHVAAVGTVGPGNAVFLGEVDAPKLRPVLEPRQNYRRDRWYMRSAAAVSWIDNDLLAVQFNDETVEARDLQGQFVAHLGARMLSRVPRPGEPGRFDVLAFRDEDHGVIHRVDPRSGKRQRVGSAPEGRLVEVAFDERGGFRAATTIDTTFWTEETTVRRWYRASDTADWQLLHEGPVTEPGFTPLYVPREPGMIVVSSRRDRDTTAIFMYDVAARREVELMAGHASEDIVYAAGLAGEVFERVTTHGLKPRVHWFDERWAAVQASVDQALPGRMNVLAGDPGGRVLVYSYSDTEPGRWHVVDNRKRTMAEIARARPKLSAAMARPTQTLTYAARDGLQVPAYLTLPAGEGPHPLVVMVHGGPALRDEWAFNAEVQLLVQHGYAVFQPQFRGSKGFGAKFEQAGRGQWGLAMQDDVTDGVRHLIERKLADPARVCIYGASYGGFAALWGLIKTPELYRCGASLAGVSDIDDLMRSRTDFNDLPASRELVRFGVGYRPGGARQFDAVSPQKHAARIRVPVLLAHGTDDRRVPYSQGRDMMRALKAAGVPCEWLPLEDEGHTLYLLDSERRFYRALLKFLYAHLGPGAGGGPAAAALR